MIDNKIKNKEGKIVIYSLFVPYKGLFIFTSY